MTQKKKKREPDDNIKIHMDELNIDYFKAPAKIRDLKDPKHSKEVPIIVSDEPVLDTKYKWEDYIVQYNLKPFIDQWTTGPTALLYYVTPDDKLVEHLREISDIPIITLKEMELLKSKNPFRKKAGCA